MTKDKCTHRVDYRGHYSSSIHHTCSQQSLSWLPSGIARVLRADTAPGCFTAHTYLRSTNTYRLTASLSSPSVCSPGLSPYPPLSLPLLPSLPPALFLPPFDSLSPSLSQSSLYRLYHSTALYLSVRSPFVVWQNG